ncbi:hypothetical protein CsatA_020364 [Cannabis sativa]
MLVFYSTSTESRKGGSIMSSSSSSFRFPRPTMPTAAAAIVVVVLMMTSTIKNCCEAAVLLQRNVTYDRYCPNGGAADDNCLIAEDLELEFLMDSHVSRILVDHPKTKTGGSGNADAPVQPCGNVKHGQAYCLTKAGIIVKVDEYCSKENNHYNRNC